MELSVMLNFTVNLKESEKGKMIYRKKRRHAQPHTEFTGEDSIPKSLKENVIFSKHCRDM